jgi:hypothetical protein
VDAVTKKAHDKILHAARKRIDAASSADQKNRERSADDLAFLIGERQWDEEIKRQREADGKPCLTINRLPQFVRHVTGQIREINPAITVVPGDNQATREVAEIYAGLIRQIEAACDASSVYEGAAESAAACGIGAWRVRADYCDPDSFDQEILIERVPNPFSVLVDPAAKRPDRADAQFMFLVEDMPLEDFEEQYPDAAKDDIADDHRPTMANFQWTRGQHVTVAEYFWIEHEEYTLGLSGQRRGCQEPARAVEGRAHAQGSQTSGQVGEDHRWQRAGGADRSALQLHSGFCRDRRGMEHRRGLVS